MLDIASLENVAKEVVEHWGTFDILINIAGGNIPSTTLTEDQTFMHLSDKVCLIFKIFFYFSLSFYFIELIDTIKIFQIVVLHSFAIIFYLFYYNNPFKFAALIIIHE